MKTIQQGDRTMYQCEKCGVMGNVEETISKGYCHNISNSRHREDERLSVVKKKQIKHTFQGTSIRKFNKYFK